MENNRVKSIKYVGYYDTPNNNFENRNFALSAINKMNYICECLNEVGFHVELVSPSITANNKCYKRKLLTINEMTNLRLFSTLPWGNKFQKIFSLLFSKLQLFFYLLHNVSRNETILVYHSLALGNVVRFASKLKGFKILLEVEEIYTDVSQFSNSKQIFEKKIVKSADKYLFATDLLESRINKDGIKDSICIYGEYKFKPEFTKPIEDGKIHLVYAGIIDLDKGGALNAINAAEFLNEKYVLHIIGFGDAKLVTEKIKELNNKNKCQIVFDGMKSGDDYLKYIQGCHIGLSTQNAQGKFSDSSFPSKVLSYLCNGLRVVTCDIKCVRESKIGDLVYYYASRPEEIAKAIEAIDIYAQYDSKSRMNDLHVEFKNELNKMLEE